MTVYLTFNDNASGVYASQVTDVVHFLRKKSTAKVKLVAFVSLRKYFSERKAIRKLCSDAIVVPMFPGVKRWRMNVITLRIIFMFVRPQSVICRGLFACNLAFRCSKKVIFDARGAYYPEFSEYKLVDDPSFTENIKKLERNAITKANKCLAVSAALVQYWKDFYHLDAWAKTRVIPCTLGDAHTTHSARTLTRAEIGFSEDDIVMVYSGSSAGWQSFDFLFTFLVKCFQQNDKIKLLFLTNKNDFSGTVLQPYANRIVTTWLKPSEIPSYLALCDYGLLMREKSVTNKVSSPTKFAEYLLAGCMVLISDEIGDFSSFVRENNCGHVLNGSLPLLDKLSSKARKHNQMLAQKHFTKETYLDHYLYLLD